VRRGRGAETMVVIVALRSGGVADLTKWRLLPAARHGRSWRLVLSTESARFTIDPQPIRIDRSRSRPVIEFSRPGAVILTVKCGGLPPLGVG